nr:hypothetical protein [Tanacetum cinerariifolium]
MRPFGCPVIILNTKDHLGKFDGKADEGFFVEYSLNSKSFRVFNSRTRIMEENLHIRFSENTPNVVGSGPDWLFNIDALTRTMNYEPIVTSTQSNGFAGTKSSQNDGFKRSSDDGKKVHKDPRQESECKDQEKKDNVNSTNTVNAASTNGVNAIGKNISIKLLFDPNIPALEDVGTFDFSNENEDDGEMDNMNNLDTAIEVSSTPRFEDPDLPDRVYKVEKALYGLHQAPRAWKELCNAFEKLMHEKFKMSYMGELTFFLGLQMKQKTDGIFICQDKYVAKILKKIRFTKVKNTSTPMENQKPLLKDEDGEEVDVHIYRSMIGSSMYLTSSRPDIMFEVLKRSTKLSLWYLKDSPFDLVAYIDSDYARASLDMKSTTGACQYLESRLISWQCKKQIMVANSTTEAKYMAASSCYGQVLWIQNQLLDYGVDGKEIIITESSVRRDLRLVDEDGADCLPNSTIFEKLELMGKHKRKNTQVPQPSGSTEHVADEAVYKERGDRLVRDATTASRLEAE